MQDGIRERLVALRDIGNDDLETFTRSGLVEAIEGSYEVELAYMLGRLDEALTRSWARDSVKMLRAIITRAFGVSETPRSADDYTPPEALAHEAASEHTHLSSVE
jgi:hypothetical protein